MVKMQSLGGKKSGLATDKLTAKESLLLERARVTGKMLSGRADKAAEAYRVGQEKAKHKK